MRKILSVVLAVVLVACATVSVVSAAQIDTAAEAAGTATVTLYDVKGGSVTQTYSVGETFTACVYLNIKNIGGGGISSVDARQLYTSSVLELADEYNKTVGNYNHGLVKDINAMLPVVGRGAIANARDLGIIYYNASTPAIEAGYMFNRDDAALIVTHYTVVAPGKATINNNITTLVEDDFDLTRIISKGVIVNNNFTSSARLSKPTLPVTFTVNGTVTSFSSSTGSDTVTVELMRGNTVVKTVKGKGDSMKYTIEGVESGKYTLRVSKENHVTRDYEITVDGDVNADAKIHLRGDVTGDGKITTADYSRVNSHARGITMLTDDYLYRCADVIGTDGNITTADASRINSHARGTAKLW